jgi:ATP-dependent Lon protease
MSKINSNNSSSKIYMNLRNRKIIKSYNYIKKKYIPQQPSSETDSESDYQSNNTSENETEISQDNNSDSTYNEYDNNIELKISDKKKINKKQIDNINLKKYRKMLSQIYPSEYINKKVEDTPNNIFLSSNSKINKSNSDNNYKRIKRNSSIKNKRHKINEDEYNKIISEDDKSEDIIQEISNNKYNSKNENDNISELSNDSYDNNESDDETYEEETDEKEDEEDNSEEIEQTEEDEDNSEESEEDDEDILKYYRKNKMNMPGKNKNFKIYFTINYDDFNKKSNHDDSNDDDINDDKNNSEEYTENENNISENEENMEYKNKERKSNKSKLNKNKQKKTDDEIYDENEIQIEILKNSTNKKDINELNRLKKINKRINDKRMKKHLKENVNYFKKLLNKKQDINDLTYFKKYLSFEEQMSVISQLEEINKYTNIEKPYQFILFDTNIPIQYKACALRRINQLKNMCPGEVEYHKIKNWVDTFMTIPFGVYKTLPVTLNDGIDKCHDFMDNAKKILDETVFGLDDAKIQIMQMIGQWISNPDAMGTAIAIKGPMGTGKTTLVKDGISKILNREFAFIALGGASDSSFLEGHSYTYEGSTWGKIVDILIKCKSMNPIIYFDELDKISQTPRGEEIIGILTHLTDTTQNSNFHDRYFSEVDFNLSKCLFIFSYNDESKVNPILLDRMYKIHTDGYNKEEKVTISNNYLIPKICDQIKFNIDDINFSTETINYIIDNYTENEEGVRNLKRCFENIYTKLNLCRLLKQGTNLFDKDLINNVTFPLNVNNDIVSKLIKKPLKEKTPYGMYT